MANQAPSWLIIILTVAAVIIVCGVVSGLLGLSGSVRTGAIGVPAGIVAATLIARKRAAGNL